MATTKTSGEQAGRLRHRVLIQRPVRDIVDGEPVVDQWEDVAQVWAAILPLRGNEYLTAEQFRPGVTTRIRIRWFDGITSEMRVIFGSKTYGIDSVQEGFDTMAYMVLMCSDGVVTTGGNP